MCGRFVLDADGQVIAYVYGVPASRVIPLERHYNIAPTQSIPVIRSDAEGRRIDLLSSR